MCRSICRHFLEGKCNYGDLCRFGHEVHELLAPVPVQAVSQAQCFNVGSMDSGDHSCIQLLNWARSRSTWIKELRMVLSCLIRSVSVCTAKCRFVIFVLVCSDDRGTMQPAPSNQSAAPSTPDALFVFPCRLHDERRWQASKSTVQPVVDTVAKHVSDVWALDLPCSTVGYAHIGDGHILINKVLCTRDVRQSEWWDDHIPSTMFFL